MVTRAPVTVAVTRGADDWRGAEAEPEGTGTDSTELTAAELDGPDPMLESLPVEMGRVALAEPEAEMLAEAPLVVYTINALTLQYASLNACGLFCTKFWHVPEHWLSAPKTEACPAKSPQKVVSKTSCMLLKWLSMVHPCPPWKLAVGFPHAAGLGFLPVTSEGALPLAQNQMLMWSEVHSVA